MDRVAGRHVCTVMHNLTGPQDVILIYGNHLVNYSQGQLKCRPNRLPPVNGRIAVKNTSASVTRRSRAATNRSSMSCASALCGWPAPIRYIGIFESTKINLRTLAQSHPAFVRCPRLEMSIPRLAESLSAWIRVRSLDGSRGPHEARAGPTLQRAGLHVWQFAEARSFPDRAATPGDACSQYECILVIDRVECRRNFVALL
jgi:hypothetical protein